VRRTFEPDLIHAHWWFPGGLVGSWASGLADVPLVTTLHGTDVRLARGSGFAQPLFRRVMQHSRIVTTVSEWLASEVRDLAPQINPVVARMPVSTATFFPAGERDPNRLLFVGRLNAQKGVRDLLLALEHTPASVQLDIVGDGVDRDDLQREARERGVAHRITWHGAVPQTALPALYRQAAALVVPSTGEGFGLVSVEAQLCETPVVAYRSGGIAETIVDGITGLLVPVGDVTSLANAVAQIIERPDFGRDMGRAGRINAIAMSSPESSARRYAEIYRRAISL
jgi:glycosyltransferase involved in cell wall biosynthesis